MYFQIVLSLLQRLLRCRLLVFSKGLSKSCYGLVRRMPWYLNGEVLIGNDQNLSRTIMNFVYNMNVIGDQSINEIVAIFSVLSHVLGKVITCYDVIYETRNSAARLFLRTSSILNSTPQPSYIMPPPRIYLIKRRDYSHYSDEMGRNT